MRGRITIVLVALAAVLLASQLLLPRYLEGRVESRLTEGGGSAHVSLRAFPALRLLIGDGERIDVSGEGLHVDPTAPRPEAFERLEGFDQVDVRLSDVTAGPFRASAVRLTRADGASGYTLDLDASVTPRDLSRFVASQLAGPVGGLLGDIAGSASSLADRPIEVDLRAGIEKVGDRWRAASGAGTVAGLPAGPVAEALAAAIVARL